MRSRTFYTDRPYRHEINCLCPECNDANRRREIGLAMGDIPAVRNAVESSDDFAPRSDPAFAVLEDWSDD